MKFTSTGQRRDGSDSRSRSTLALALLRLDRNARSDGVFALQSTSIGTRDMARKKGASAASAPRQQQQQPRGWAVPAAVVAVVAVAASVVAARSSAHPIVEEDACDGDDATCWTAAAFDGVAAGDYGAAAAAFRALGALDGDDSFAWQWLGRAEVGPGRGRVGVGPG